MNWDAIGAIGEVVGAIAVIVTIAYLARQVRENSKQMRVGSLIALNHLVNEGFDPIYNDDRSIRIWTQGHAAPEELDAEDEAVFSLYMSRLVVVMQTALSHGDYGVELHPDDVDRYLGSLKGILESPGGRAWRERMDGESYIMDRTRAMLAGTDMRQTAIVRSHARQVEGDPR